MTFGDSIEIKGIKYSEEEIRERVRELGRRIEEDYKDDPEDLVVVGVIKGSLYFFADLTRAINLPIKIDLIGFGNIPDTTSRTGVVKITKDLDIDITGKNVIIVEDVIRTGLTTAYLISCLEPKKPKSIEICSMLLNPDRILMTMPVKYYGFEINDSWLLGMGMDRNEIGRNLPYIAEIKKQ